DAVVASDRVVEPMPSFLLRYARSVVTPGTLILCVTAQIEQCESVRQQARPFDRVLPLHLCSDQHESVRGQILDFREDFLDLFDKLGRERSRVDESTQKVVERRRRTPRAVD